MSAIDQMRGFDDEVVVVDPVDPTVLKGDMRAPFDKPSRMLLALLPPPPPPPLLLFT